jgi:hypothetical protein
MFELHDCEVGQSHAELVCRAKRYGIVDSRNTQFLLENKKNPELLKIMEKFIEDEEPERLFNPFLKLEGQFFNSLTGFLLYASFLTIILG